jgi:UPF0042 nucleotide-binding protein
MKFLIISGMSGAGKTRAADVLEDMDYYCVDNMPAALLPKLAEFCMGMGGRYEKVALVTDIRDKDGVDAIFDSLDQLWALGCDYQILFMEADLPTIVNRYKESRRPHPLQAEAGGLEAAVLLESKRLDRLRVNADFVINTTGLTLGMLQAEIYKRFMGSDAQRKLDVTVISFGFKYGIPIEADMVLDARFLPNPYYVEALRGQTGMDSEVYDYVFGSAAAQEFMQHLQKLFAFLLPRYVEEGKTGLCIAVGCTGGRHRSVAVAQALCEMIRTLGHGAELVNRDMEK